MILILGAASLAVSGISIPNAVGSFSLMSQVDALILSCACGGAGLSLTFLGMVGFAIFRCRNNKKTDQLGFVERAILPSPDQDFKAFKHRIMAKYSVDADGQLVAKKTNLQTGLSAHSLKRFIKDSKNAFAQKRADSETSIVTFYKRKITFYKNVDGNLFIASKTNDGAWQLYWKQNSSKDLGAGQFGSVRVVLNLKKAREDALKSALEDNKDCLKNEDVSLNLPGVEGMGIQAPSTAFVDPSKDVPAFMIGKLYEGSLVKKANPRTPIMLTLKEGLRCAYHLLTGLERGHRIGLIFGDRKAENVLFINEQRYDLADLGGTYINFEVEKRLKTNGSIDLLRNIHYVFGEDLIAEREALRAQNIKLFILILQKQDVLAVGITLWEVLTGKNFPTTETKYQGGDRRKEKELDLYSSTKEYLLHAAHLKPRTKKALLALLEPRHKKRPAAGQALKSFKTALAKDYKEYYLEFLQQEQIEQARVAAKQAYRARKRQQ
jgi:hypothetical protein